MMLAFIFSMGPPYRTRIWRNIPFLASLFLLAWATAIMAISPGSTGTFNNKRLELIDFSCLLVRLEHLLRRFKYDDARKRSSPGLPVGDVGCCRRSLYLCSYCRGTHCQKPTCPKNNKNAQREAFAQKQVQGALFSLTSVVSLFSESNWSLNPVVPAGLESQVN